MSINKFGTSTSKFGEKSNYLRCDSDDLMDYNESPDVVDVDNVYEFVNRRDENDDGVTALMIACRNSINDSHYNIVRSLLENYANPFLINGKGQTALDLARVNNNEEICKIITHYCNNIYQGNADNVKSYYDGSDCDTIL